MPRLLLFAATTGYQIRVFAEAARQLGIDLTLATDRCHVLEDPWGDRAIPVRFTDITGSLETLRGGSFDGVVALGDLPTVLAAEAAAMLGIPFHSAAAVRACHDKHAARRLFAAAGLPVPQFFRVPLDANPEAVAAEVPYPCVLKPLTLSASRGVIRADDRASFVAAFQRIRKLLETSPDVRMTGDPQNRFLQVEAYIPGREFAVEGLVSQGMPWVLAIFDKPDPLEGPFFEETIYVTPSRESAPAQQQIRAAVERAVRALGLHHGPFHAELRLNDQGAWMLEVAARPIGGLCAKALRFGDAMGLEELLIRHALGEDVAGIELSHGAAGVMMIPIPRHGVYESVAGVEEAGLLPDVEDVIITAKAGQLLIPLPEGASYLGFIFARARTAGDVERALREAHGKLEFSLQTALQTG